MRSMDYDLTPDEMRIALNMAYVASKCPIDGLKFFWGAIARSLYPPHSAKVREYALSLDMSDPVLLAQAETEVQRLRCLRNSQALLSQPAQ